MEEKTKSGKKRRLPRPAFLDNVSGIFAKRSIIILTVFAVVLAYLIGVIFKMQVFDYEFYQQEVINELTLGTPLTAKRGSILDVNGNVLATNKTVYLIFISPDDILDKKRETGEPYDEFIARRLSSILDLDYDTVFAKTQKEGRKYEKIKDGVEEEQKDEILKLVEEYELDMMIYARAESTRYYPYGTLASHVIGFTGADNQGLFGLFKLCRKLRAD